MNVSRFDMLECLDRDIARRERLSRAVFSARRFALIDRDLEVMRAVRALVAELAWDEAQTAEIPSKVGLP